MNLNRHCRRQVSKDLKRSGDFRAQPDIRARPAKQKRQEEPTVRFVTAVRTLWPNVRIVRSWTKSSGGTQVDKTDVSGVAYAAIAAKQLKNT
jgi:hypothetical protein